NVDAVLDPSSAKWNSHIFAPEIDHSHKKYRPDIIGGTMRRAGSKPARGGGVMWIGYRGSVSAALGSLANVLDCNFRDFMALHRPDVLADMAGMLGLMPAHFGV